MESQQPARTHRKIHHGLVALALCLLGGSLEAAPADARVVLNTDRYVVGSKWSLDLLVDSPDPLSVRVPVPVLPSALALVDGPYIRETSWEKVPGTLSRATKVSLTLRALAPGIVEVGPFEVRVGSRTQIVPAVTVFLLSADEAKRRFPVEVRWVRPEGNFYEGQSIPLMLQARNLDTLAQPQDVGLVAPAGSLWEKAVGLGEIEINSVGEDRLMNIPWGGWMVIPTKPGTMNIPAIKASVAGLTRTALPLTLTILPLPPEVAASRAVGNFSYSIDAKTGETATDGQLIVTQEVAGRGNFPYLQLPPVTADGLTLMSRQEGTHYRAAKNGYEGSLVVTWRFSADRSQSVTLKLPGFQSFQPATGRVDVWDPRLVVVNLTLPSASTAPATPVDLKLDWNGVLEARPWPLAHSWWSAFLFLPGPLLLLSTFFFGGKGRGLLVLLALSLVLSSAGEPPLPEFEKAMSAQGAEAVARWSALCDSRPDEPGLWYNKALACVAVDRTAEAVHAFRMAQVAGFQGNLAAAGLKNLEEKELLNDQFVPWTGWPTNYLFLLLCFSENLAFALWALQRTSGSSVWLMPLSLAVMAMAAFGVFSVGAQAARLEPDAVIGLSDGPIRKVPGDLAETWMTLKAGTVVKIQGKSDRWVLVQTGYGLEGWVEEAGLLKLELQP